MTVEENQQTAPAEETQITDVNTSVPDVNADNQTVETTLPAIDEDAIALSYLKKQGFEVENAEDLQRYKTPQIKEVNPYDEFMDDEDKKYFEFKKTTGKTKAEYEMLRTDPDSISPLEYAIEKAKNDSGLSLTKEEALEFLEEELGISDFDELTSTDKIKLAKYSKELKDKRVSMFNELKNISVEKPQNQNQPEMVTLDNGQTVPKEQYEQFNKNRQQYLNANKESVNSVTSSEFKVMLDDNGSPREVAFTYEFNDQDKHSMLSMTEDTGKLIERYNTEKGFNHKQFNEDAFWLDPANRNKAISTIIQKALATNTEEVLKGRGNVNFSHQPLPAQKKEGVEMVQLSDLFKL